MPSRPPNETPAAEGRLLASVAMLEISGDGYLIHATDRARQLLARHGMKAETIAEKTRDCGRLWLDPQGRLPVIACLNEWEDISLTARLAGRVDGHFQILLAEEDTSIRPREVARRFGLTSREGEVLRWIAEGKTSAEIGSILGCKPRTVQKHTERVLAKLGVETRTAAAGAYLAAMMQGALLRE